MRRLTPFSRTVGLVLGSVLVLSACVQDPGPDTTDPPDLWGDAEPPPLLVEVETEPVPETRHRALGEGSADGVRATAEEVPSAPPPGEPVRSETEERASGGSTDGARDAVEQGSPSLRAGIRDDHEKFDDYLGFYHGYEGNDVCRFDVTERWIIRVRDAAGRAVPNARVEVGTEEQLLFRAITDANGSCAFFPRGYEEGRPAEGWTVRVRALGEERVVRREAPEGVADGTWTVALEEAERTVPDAVPVFCGFVLDTTGSMGDEIARLRRTLDEVVARLGELPGRPRLHFGLVTYRDRGDAYVTRVHDFTSDVAAFRETLADLEASGGGDGPEDVQRGLADAMARLRWPEGEGINVSFLIGDARPHLYEDEPTYVESAFRAVDRGVKIFSLAASGLDPAGEFAFRQVAMLTGGRFIFLTYGPDDHTPHDVGTAGEDYESNRLEDVIVRAVTGEVETFVGGREVAEGR